MKTLPEGYNSESELMCINTEWGNFGAPCLPRLEEDLCALHLCTPSLLMLQRRARHVRRCMRRPYCNLEDDSYPVYLNCTGHWTLPAATPGR